MYTAVPYWSKDESNIITEAVIILHNLMVKIRKRTEKENTENIQKVLLTYLEIMVNQFSVKMTMM